MERDECAPGELGDPLITLTPQFITGSECELSSAR